MLIFFNSVFYSTDIFNCNLYDGKFCRLKDLLIVYFWEKEMDEGVIWRLKENFKNLFESKIKS